VDGQAWEVTARRCERGLAKVPVNYAQSRGSFEKYTVTTRGALEHGRRVLRQIRPDHEGVEPFSSRSRAQPASCQRIAQRTVDWQFNRYIPVG